MRTWTALWFCLIPFLQVFGVVSGVNPEVKVIHAEGRIIQQETYISWSTEFELNPTEFIIEGTTNGTEWVVRGRVKSQGTASQKAEYEFVDTRDDGIKTYRIRFHDAKGRAQLLAQFKADDYSVDVSLEEIVETKPRKLVLKYHMKQDQELLVRVYNRIGEEVFTKSLPSTVAGAYFYDVDISLLKPDNYLLVVTQALVDKTVAELAFQIKK